MTVIGPSVRRSGLPSTDFYAPNFRVEVEGQELDPESKGDVLELKVVLDMENMSSFEMTVNNWDDRHLRFKYSDTDALELGHRVHVLMGYADRLVSMVRGQISTVAPKFPESGSPTLVISGLDGMLRLRDRQPEPGEPRSYTEMADWEIAEAIATRNGLRVEVTREGEAHDLVVQKNQDDASFLMERATRIDFDCYVQTDAESGEDTLFFIRPTDARDGSSTRVYQLEWGKNLIEFNPEMTLSRQVSEITVRGWDPATKQTYIATVGPDDLPGAGGSDGNTGGASGPQAVADTLGGKTDVVVDAPVTSEQEARELALSLLTERAYEFITGSGRVIGLPDLRPGDNLDLAGLGDRFSGRYYVKKVEHTLGSSGYTTNFDVRRMFAGAADTADAPGA